MASRRLLKKNIKLASIELINECYVLLAFVPKIKNEKMAELITKVLSMNANFVVRANRPDGKSNPALVKAYYKKLKQDWAKELDVLVKDLTALSEKK